MKNLMLLGTASGVGKSTIATAFCRHFTDKGILTAPFKPQNMSTKSFVIENGARIGVAQAAQAEACRVKPRACHNPILLKPMGNGKSQLFVSGAEAGEFTAAEYRAMRDKLWNAVIKAYAAASEGRDLMIMEGAGGCAELNLMTNDIGNENMAIFADAPEILVADIDRGGVFGAVVGSLALLNEPQRVKGVIINKFRGDKDSFKEGIRLLEEKIHCPVLGVVPYTAFDIEDEDGVTERDGAPMRTDAAYRERQYDLLAAAVSDNVDMDAVWEIINT